VSASVRTAPETTIEATPTPTSGAAIIAAINANRNSEDAHNLAHRDTNARDAASRTRGSRPEALAPRLQPHVPMSPLSRFAWLTATTIGISFAGCSSDDDRPKRVGPGTAAGTGGSTASSSGNGTGGIGGAPRDDLDAWCKAVYPAFCEAVFACCDDPQVLDDLGSVEECASPANISDCNAGNIRDIFDAGLTELNTAKLDACVAELEAMAGGTCTKSPWHSLLLCYGALEGQVEAGESCSDYSLDDDISFVLCQDGLCNNGECEAFLPAGATCEHSGDLGTCHIHEGQACVDDGAGGLECGDPAPIGGSCVEYSSSFDLQCESLNCDNDTCAAPDGADLCDPGPI
jgi:hypothetical protein